MIIILIVDNVNDSPCVYHDTKRIPDKTGILFRINIEQILFVLAWVLMLPILPSGFHPARFRRGK